MIHRLVPAGYRRFALFLVAGAINTCFGYAAFSALILLGARPPLAVFASTVAGILFNFRSLGMVFGDRGSRRFVRFVAVYAVLFAINVALLRALAAGGLGPLVAQALALPPLAILSFLLMRGIVFAPASLRGSSR